MRGEINKRHNRKIRKPCPVCGSRVVVAHGNIWWWVVCSENRDHIPQDLYLEPIDAIRAWNGAGEVLEDGFYLVKDGSSPASPREAWEAKKRVVYRGEVYDALESARINALDGVLTDRYKDGFHDGLKRALEILANEVQDVPAITPAEEGE